MEYNEIRDRFPGLYKEHPYCGAGWPVGWSGIIVRLSYLLDRHVRATGVDFQLAQIKEKFGGLRFYYDGGDDFVRELVDAAEEASLKVCEDCGADGVRYQPNYWITTLCGLCIVRVAEKGRWELPLPESGTAESYLEGYCER